MASWLHGFTSSLLVLPLLLDVVVMGVAADSHHERFLIDTNIRGIPYPYYRFKLWENVDTNIQTNILGGLNYTEEDWNTPGSALIESYGWDNIVANLSELVDPISNLGFQIDVWDCYQNHYDDYFWFQLEELGVQQYYEELGWTEESWLLGFPTPDSEEKFWDELSGLEQNAATQLCYNIGSWNFLGMALWPELPEAPPTATPTTAQPSPSPSSSPTVQDATSQPSATPTSVPSVGPTGTPVPTNLPSSTPTSSPTSSVLPPSPNTNLQAIDAIRYVLWDDLGAAFQASAEVLGYTNATWNLPGSDPIEVLSYDGVSRSGVEGGIDAINAIGMDANVWDCHINHFGGYAWDDLGENQIYWKALGWSELSWAAVIDPPATSSKEWSELSERERDAATKLCYRQELWDYLPLSEWGEEDNGDGTIDGTFDDPSLINGDHGDAATTTTMTFLVGLFTSGLLFVFP